MARVFSSGFELGTGGVMGGAVGDLVPDGDGALGVRDTAVKRSGESSIRLQSNNGTNIWYRGAGSGWANAFIRIFFRKSGETTAEVDIVRFFNVSSALVGLCSLKTDGTLVIKNSASVQQGSPSPALANDVWHKLEFNIINTGASVTITARLNGTAFVTTATTHGVAGDTNQLRLLSPSGGANGWWDDLSVNSNGGAINNSWPADSKVLALFPVSDNQVGSWTAGAGGLTNLWEALNNTPPTGKQVPGNTDQIVSTDTTGDNTTDEYRANLASYASVGISAGDTINFLQTFCCHGETAAAGTKTGSVAGLSNPVQTLRAFTFGNDVGAYGTWGTGWYWISTVGIESPTVTLGTSPVLATRKTDATAGASDICSLVTYVDVTPAAPAGGVNLNLKDSFKMPLAVRKILKRTLRV